MPVDPIRVRDIFLAAVELSTEDRPKYLAEACQDDAELRAEVDRLLAANANPDSILEPGSPTAAFDPDPQNTTEMATELDRDEATVTHADPVATTAADKPHPSSFPKGEGIGTVIAGRYTLVEVLGEGGMGTVYRAGQTDPVKRDVALKLIKRGMDSRQVLARFDSERQALALMDHPNIARIFDGGVTTSGQPFFVMELVKGAPITKYCDEKRLTVKARLELFVAVCQAVQHAHQKGIIHRDLKPGNVLVAEVDGRPTPKVIDFGVAKATEFKLTEQSLSDTGAIVGTPAYMSPEQADPSSMDIDTRTDVYSLGVILYELLVGSSPLEAKHFHRGAVLEMLRMVREVDPPKPSTKLSSAEALPNIAANRSIEPARLSKLLQGELDWVVMKALEKDRNRRYDTANGFAHDIHRYLADEVVEARPPSRGYRLRKWLRRNKVAVVAAIAIWLVTLGQVGFCTLQWIKADDARMRAEDAERGERVERGKPDVSWKEAKRKAEQERRARKVAVTTLRDITRYVELRNLTRIQVTEDGLSVRGNDVQDLLQDPLLPAERELLTKLMNYYVASARELSGVTDQPLELARAYSDIGRIHQQFGDNSEAETAFRAALAICQQFHDTRNGDPDLTGQLLGAHSNLAKTLMTAGRHADAVSHWDEVLQISPVEERPNYRLSRARALARTTRVGEAVAEAKALLSELSPNSLPHYNTACVFAQATSNGGANADEFARRHWASQACRREGRVSRAPSECCNRLFEI